MKTSNSTEETPKSTSSKSSKKSSSNNKSRKSTKSSTPVHNDAHNNAAGTSSATNTSMVKNINSNNISNSHPTTLLINCNSHSNHSLMATTPTTPTTSNMFDSSLGGSGGSGGTSAGADGSNSGSRSHQKTYAGLEPRSIKVMWEQHDQSDLELSAEVCARIAEDASYKLWELINNIKTYARHSGGVVTYDLVNEVMREADVPPALGAMDSDWDRIDYDGSYFFYSDKILELRDEYQKDVSLTLPDGPDFACSWPMEDKNMEYLKKYVPNLIYVALYGDASTVDDILTEAVNSPLIGSCYKLLLTKILQILAFKQSDELSSRCWRLLRALISNRQTRDVECRLEYFHLAEVLICQLLSAYECIKSHTVQEHPTNGEVKLEEATVSATAIPEQTIKMEIDEVKMEQHLDLKTEFMDINPTDQTDAFQLSAGSSQQVTEEKIYKLTLLEDEDTVELQQMCEFSPYFASPVNWKYIDELSQTIGMLAAQNGYFQSECLCHITRRLERFFEGRSISTEREYNFISRALHGLIALGEYAFREFTPYLYKLNIDEIPFNLWNDFAQSAMFLGGADDIYLYEWLEYVCGADKLQPFMIYYADYHDKLLTHRYLKLKPPTFCINPKPGVRRLEWSTPVAKKSLKPKITKADLFPDLVEPNLSKNRAGNIRFKFAGCRPVILKPKVSAIAVKTDATASSNVTLPANDVLIARRKLFKSLTNKKRVVPLSGYHFLRI